MIKVMAFISDFLHSLKNENTWCKILGNFKIPNAIQSREHSKDGVKDDVLHIMAQPEWQPQRRLPQLGWQAVDLELQLA